MSVSLILEGFNRKTRAFHLLTLGCPSFSVSFASLRPSYFACVLPCSQAMNCFVANLNILLFQLLTGQGVDLKIKIRVCCVCVCVLHLSPVCGDQRRTSAVVPQVSHPVWFVLQT